MHYQDDMDPPHYPHPGYQVRPKVVRLAGRLLLLVLLATLVLLALRHGWLVLTA